MLDQALGKLAQDEAQYGKTELDVKRFTPLARDQAISQEQLDDAVQANLAARAAILADKAAVETRHAQPRLLQNHFAHRRHRRNRPGANRRPGRAGHRRADHGIDH